MSESNQKIVAKLIKIYEKIDHVEKAGENTTQHYHYVRAADVVRAIRAAFIEEGIYAEINFEFTDPPYTIARAKDPNAPFSAVNVKCCIVLHDQASGETTTASGLGTGADTSDKAVYKAQTGALKYALRHAALLPDEAGTDPEADESVDEGAEQPRGRAPQRADMPDFQDAQHDAPKQRVNAIDGQHKPSAASAQPAAAPTPDPKPQAAPAAPQAAPVPPAAAPAPTEREPGDEPADTAMPTEAEMGVFRKQFGQLGDDLSLPTGGKLKASKGLPVNRKLLVFLLSITGASEAKNITKAQWENFFQRADAAKQGENGLVNLAKLVNKTNGIEEKK